MRFVADPEPKAVLLEIDEAIHSGYILQHFGANDSMFWAVLAECETKIYTDMPARDLTSIIANATKQGWEVVQLIALPDGHHFNLVVKKYV